MNVADYISIVAVTVAVAALIWQTWLNARQARLQNFTAYTERYQNIMLQLPVAIASDDFDLQRLSEEEKETTLRWLRAYFDLCSEEHYLKKRKLVEKEVWKLWEGGMRDSVKKPAYRQAWDIIQKDKYYSSEFESFITFLRSHMQNTLEGSSGRKSNPSRS